MLSNLLPVDLPTPRRPGLVEDGLNRLHDFSTCAKFCQPVNNKIKKKKERKGQRQPLNAGCKQDGEKGS